MSDAVEWVNRHFSPVVAVICTVLLVAIWVYHSYLKCAIPNEKTSNLSTFDRYVYRTMQICQYLLMVFFSINNIAHIPVYCQSLKTDTECEIFIALAWISFPLGKAAMYLLWFGKIYAGFSNSIYRYSHRWFIAAVVVLAGFAFVVVGLTLQLVAKYEYSNGYDCLALYPKWGYYFLAVFDSVIPMICLFMFIRPLFKLSSSHNRDDKTDRLFLLIRRYSLLTVIAVITSIVSNLSLAVVDIRLFYDIDCVANIICVLLMLSLYEKEYKWLCTPAENCLCRRFKVMDALEMMASVQSSPGSPASVSLPIGDSDIPMESTHPSDMESTIQSK